MRRHSLLVAWCLLAAARAAPTTPETLVVTATDDQPAVKAAPSPPSTAAPPPPIKLTEMEVKSEVALRYARTAVLTRVRNPAAIAQEATFRVLLPETAFISGFVMSLGGKSYKAYVKEKEEAKQIYNQAVSQGIGAAHVATKARDSNHFTVSVNVEPNTEAVFNITYEELLVRRNSLYSHAVNLHPGALVPKLTVTVHIKEAQKITNLKAPAVRTGNEVDDESSENSKAVIERGHDDREATVTFSPDLEEQKRLMAIYAEKSKESRRPSYQPWYQAQPEDESRVEGVLGQFVVQYDVDRPTDGEILVNDGYFVHYFAPPSLPPLHKHVVFVLDTSGSMHSRKIEQLRDAMTSILMDLREGDYFNIVEFSSFVKVHDLNSTEEFKKPSYYYDEQSQPVALVPPARASPANIQRAQGIIKGLTADGGTYIDRALSVAVDLIHAGVHWTAPATPLPTPPAASEATPPAPTTELVDEAGRAARDVPAGKDEAARPEPMIIFLTDGEPTIGESNTDKIISRLSEKNFGERKATIFSLAFGEDADRSFLRKLSLRNDGFMRHIYEAADSALQLRHFYSQVASPLLADVTFTYPAAQIKEGSLTKRKFRTYFSGSEVLVAGRLDDTATELTADVDAFCGVADDDAARKRYKISPKVPVVRKSGEYLPLERVWAYLTIQQLLDERDAEDKREEEKGPAKRALELALKYEFVTPLTSLVVVKPNATTAVDSESVDKTLGGGGYALSAQAPMGINHQYSSLIVGGAPVPGPSASFSFAPSSMASADSVLFEEEYDAGGDTASVLSESVQSSFGPLKASAGYGPSYRRPAFHLAQMGAGGGGGGATHSYIGHSGTTAMSYGGFNQGMGQIMLDSVYESAFDSMPGRGISRKPAVQSGQGAAGFPAPPAYPVPTVSRLPTPPLPATPSPAPPSTPAAAPALAVYHLQQFPWAAPLIDPLRDELYFENANATEVRLKLNREKAKATVGADPPCPRSVAGAAGAAGGAAGGGTCVYLTRCAAAKNITADLYRTVYCALENGFAGVCCPDRSVDLPAKQPAADFP